MAYLRLRGNQCGRTARKPSEGSGDLGYENDEDLPIQLQIDNLRAKISLKERYNKALREEFMESKKGANQIIGDFQAEIDYLHIERREALAAGISAGAKALRNHRPFILALRGRRPEQVLDWLDDQIGDQRKLLDRKVHDLQLIKLKLNEAEATVDQLEKWPYPGSTPWERAAIDEFTRLGVAIARMQALKDSAKILNIKYHQINNQLRSERDGWPYAVMKVEKSCRDFKNELDDLQMMMEDAVRLKKTTYYRLIMTEKEYVENRKARHNRLNKIRKMCENEIRQNHKRFHGPGGGSGNGNKEFRMTASKTMIFPSKEQTMKYVEELSHKRAKVQEFEDEARNMVHAMRVPDIRFCPARIQTVFHLCEVLQEEYSTKKAAVKLLLKQKNYLFLFKQFLFYTGANKEEEFEISVRSKTDEIAEVKRKTEEAERKAQRLGDVVVDAHQGMIGLLTLLAEGKKVSLNFPGASNPIALMQKALSQIRPLVERVIQLSDLFTPEMEPQRNYSQYVRQQVAKDAIRVGAMHEAVSGESDSDDDDAGLFGGFGYDRVLTREDVKANSNKVYSQALLKQGLKEAQAKAKTRIRKKQK